MRRTWLFWYVIINIFIWSTVYLYENSLAAAKISRIYYLYLSKKFTRHSVRIPGVLEEKLINVRNLVFFIYQYLDILEIPSVWFILPNPYLLCSLWLEKK